MSPKNTKVSNQTLKIHSFFTFINYCCCILYIQNYKLVVSSPSKVSPTGNYGLYFSRYTYSPTLSRIHFFSTYYLLQNSVKLC